MEDDPIAAPSTIRATLALTFGSLLLSGCAHLYDPIDAALTCLHCEKRALHTWTAAREHYACVNYPHHFGEGFRAGYVDVCLGGTGCPPTLPPKCYWSIWYRNPAGRAKTVEWFNGFTAGAAAAQQEGLQQFGELVTATEIRGGCNCEPAEYDLSDLPAESSMPPQDDPQQLLTPPAPHESDPDMPSARQEWPPAVPPTFAVPPVPPAWGHSTPEEPSYTAAPAAEPHLSEDPPSDPAEPAESVPNEPHATEIDPPASTQAVPAPADAADQSTRLPFGHSLLPSTTPATDDLPETQENSDLRIYLWIPESEAAPAPEAVAPDPFRNLPLDAETPFAPPATAEPDQSVEELIPLEDRFLPRPDQKPVTRPAVDPTVSRRSRPRSLFQMLNQIEQTSHQSGSTP